MKRPSKVAFIVYAKSKGFDVELAGEQWEAWMAGDWRDGNNDPIKNWKAKLYNFATYGYGVFGTRRRVTKPGKDRIEESRQSAEARQRKADAYERRKRDDAIQ